MAQLKATVLLMRKLGLDTINLKPKPEALTVGGRGRRRASRWRS